LKIKDDDQSMACIFKELESQKEESCPAQFILLHSENNCEPCEEEMRQHAEGIKKGLIRLVSIESPEGLAIMATNEIDFFPVLMLIDCQKKAIE